MIMMSVNQMKLAEKSLLRQQQLIEALNTLVKDVERVERTILALQGELAEVNRKHQGPRTTRQDIDYLSGLLECAKKKLAWEKQVASLQKPTPLLLEQMTALLNDPLHPPAEQNRDRMLLALQKVQAAMERLQAANVL